MKLERLELNCLSQGMVVVCFEVPGTISVGRIASEVIVYPQQQALLTGVFAEFDLLYADQHRIAQSRIWSTYFYRNADAPLRSGLFTWPEELMPLTFDRAESRVATYPGWLVHINVRHDLHPMARHE